MICTKCGTELPDGVKFCGICGSSLLLPAPAPEAEPVAAAPTAAESAAAVPVAAESVPAPAPVAGPAPAPTAEPAPEIKYCTVCGAKNGAEFMFCEKCGCSFAPTAQGAALPAGQAALAPTVIRVDNSGGGRGKLMKILPIVCAAVFSIPLAVRLVFFFKDDLPNFAEVSSAQSALNKEHSKALKDAQQEKQKLETDIPAAEAELSRLSEEKAAKTAEAEKLDAQISELSAEVERYRLMQENDALFAAFEKISDNYDKKEYADEKISEMIISKQNDMYKAKTLMLDSMKGYLSLNIGSYQVEPPMDIKKEFLKEVIGNVADQYDNDIAGVLADTGKGVLDGDSISDALKSNIQEAIQNKILDTVTGGLYGKLSSAANTAGDVSTFINNITSRKPVYVASYITNQMQLCAAEITAFIDKPAPSTKDLCDAIEAYNKLCLLADSLYDLTSDSNAYFDGHEETCAKLTDIYSSMLVNDNAMVYYFAMRGKE